MFEEKRKDKRLVVIEIILIVLIFFMALVIYWLSTTTTFEDPIATMKNNFLTLQIRLIGISIIATAIVSVFSKSKKKLVRNLAIVVVVSIIMIIMQVGLKIFIDNKCNEEEFARLYETYKEDDDRYYKDISISLSGVEIIGAKESYIKKSINAYNIFKLKTISYIIIHILIVILILYIINRIVIIENNKTKLARDDEIFGDK